MKNKEELKKLFENRDIPKQEDFWEWMDSYWHKEEEIPMDNFNIDVSSKADKTAMNLSNDDVISWRQKLEILDIPTQVKIDTGINFSTKTMIQSYTQNGKNVIINNGTNNLDIVCDSTSETDFIATYIKYGTGTITFKSGSGNIISSMDGTLKLNGGKGSRAMICRINNEFLIFIQNVQSA